MVFFQNFLQNIINICKWLTTTIVTRFAKGVLYARGLRYTFQNHSIATSIDQQYMCVILAKLKQSASQACLTSKSVWMVYK